MPEIDDQPVNVPRMAREDEVSDLPLDGSVGVLDLVIHEFGRGEKMAVRDVGEGFGVAVVFFRRRREQVRKGPDPPDFGTQPVR